MASVRLSTLLQPVVDRDKAQLALVFLITKWQESKISIPKRTQYRWDTPYLMEKFEFWNSLRSPEVLDKWHETIFPSIKKNNETEKSKIICLIEAAYGIELAWILANLPELDWYLHEKRRVVGARLLLTLLEFIEAQAAVSTAPCSCQAEHLPSTPAAVEGSPDQYQHEEVACTKDKPHKIQTIHGAATWEVQASSTLPSLPSTLSSKTAKRPRAEFEDASCIGNFGTGVSGYEASQNPISKRLRPAHNATAEPVSEGSSTPTFPCDGGIPIVVSSSGWISTVMEPSSLSSADQDQHMTGSNWGFPTETPIQYEVSTRTILAEFLHPELIQDMSQKPKVHPWNTYNALSFLMETNRAGYILDRDHETYTYYNIPPNRPGVLLSLTVYMPEIKKWITEIQNAGEAAKIERVVVVLPKDLAATDSLLIISAPQL